MKYNPLEIEQNWQQYWADHKTFKAQQPNFLSSGEGRGEDKPKYYVLDMFPYPSGAGLHVGHPLGYIASDIVARYKRHKGFNVLHPQGYDSFGLPAEQYAIQTGQHPEKTTRENIARYREQLDKIGFSFDWDREVRTSNPDYYKHTQWIFIQLFNSWYNNDADKAEDISTLIAVFSTKGNATVNAVCDENIVAFSAAEWNAFSSDEQQKILLHYRLTYLAETEVNWCPGLGTVLANDEIVNGVSERGGHPVIRKKMTQWSMRISAYAERLLQGLDTIDWNESIKESQRNWIGKSIGAEVVFNILTPALSKGEGAQLGYMTGDGLNASILLNHAKEMRKQPTPEEDTLWEEIRNRKLESKFRRQHLIGNFIADFVCLEKKLIIEVDGGYHNSKEQQELDEERTLVLEQKHGFKVIRFTNEEVNSEIGNVLTTIKQELSSRETPLSFGEGLGVRIFTTRPDTIFGVTFMTLAPEHELVAQITTPEQKAAVEAYVEATAKRSERERMADVKTISGVFTGAYAEHPFTKEPIPVWIGDYVLAGYGTGAVMAVPAGDERDYAFAKHFNISIKNIFNVLNSPPSEGLGEDKAFAEKSGFELINSDFLNGLGYKEATKKIIEQLEAIGQGKGKTNYRLRDAVFSRQRYWGEPIPIYYKNDIPYPIPTECLPLKLPEVEKYLPTEDGQPPLGNAKEWYWDEDKKCVTTPPPSEGAGGRIELNTMPGWAGSSWYWMRYMDASNETEFASAEAINYWESVDLYVGGSEHATGHLLYSRFWNKFLKDKGFAPTEEPFKKLINQGMILGMSAYAYVYRLNCVNISEGDIAIDVPRPDPILISKKSYDEILKGGKPEQIEKWINEKYGANKSFEVRYRNEDVNPIHIDISLINDITNELNIEAFKNHPLYSDYKEATFIMENGKVLSFGEDLGEDKYIVGREVEKMSKSKYNVVNPDDICNEYGADTLRLYEMFLGPLEQAKPWNTAGITGVFGFLKKLWRLYFDNNGLIVTDEEPTAEMYKALHKTIKKVTEDIENFSFNTSVSQFMICVNELAQLKCHHRAILEPLSIVISPYAPHIAEELWKQLGHQGSISTVDFPVFDSNYLVESEKEYPVSFNGKMRFTIKLPLDLTPKQIEEIVLADERTIAQLAGNTPKKVIIVPGKIINLVG